MTRLAVALLLAIFTGCDSADTGLSGTTTTGDTTGAGTPAPPIPDAEPSIRGIVTATADGSVQVEANPADESGTPKAVVRLTPETEVAYRAGGAARTDELTVGHNVSVWFEGPVAESYPVQATAATIIIEPAGGPVLP